MAEATGKISSWRTVRTFLKVGTCSETLCNVLDRAFDDPLELEERAALPFAGGIVQHGYQCGLIWGAALAAGARAFRLFGPGPDAETRALLTAQRLVDSMRARYGEIDCLELTQTDWRKSAKVLKYFIKGGTFKCFGMAAGFARIAHGIIDTAAAAKPAVTLAPPVSCASVLARKQGASEREAVMAAGLAGGIGLSGDACGALGTAIWINAMYRLRGGEKKIRFYDPEALALIEKFLKVTDYEFECSKIVGRKFETVEDHAGFVRGGGCSEIIEALTPGLSKPMSPSGRP